MIAFLNGQVSFLTAIHVLMQSETLSHFQMSLTIKQDAFNYTMREWRVQYDSYLQKVSGTDLLSCQACSDVAHAIHIDGNAELYRYASAGSKYVLNTVQALNP